MPIIASAINSTHKGALVPIAFVTETSMQNTSIINIPQNYQDLEIHVFTNTQQSGSIADYLYLGFNGLSSGYSNTRMNSDGSTFSSNRTSNDNGLYPMIRPAYATNLYGSCIIHILSYSDTTKFKTIVCRAGSDQNGSGAVQLTTGTWQSTAAINQLLFGGTGNYPGIGSTFAIYGVRAAGQ